MQDPCRPSVKNAIQLCINAGVKVFVVFFFICHISHPAHNVGFCRLCALFSNKSCLKCELSRAFRSSPQILLCLFRFWIPVEGHDDACWILSCHLCASITVTVVPDFKKIVCVRPIAHLHRFSVFEWNFVWTSIWTIIFRKNKRKGKKNLLLSAIAC